jgi:hypothetical protein
VTAPPAGPRAPAPPQGPDPARARFRRQRRRAAVASAVALLALAGVGALLGAPNELAAVRLLGVSLGWWGAWAGLGIMLGTVVWTSRRAA